jgi:hypothetical protein
MPAPTPCSNGCIPCGRDKSRRDKSFPPAVCRTLHLGVLALRATPSSGASPMAETRVAATTNRFCSDGGSVRGLRIRRSGLFRLRTSFRPL